MQLTHIFLSSLSLVVITDASPLDIQKLKPRQQWNPFSPCTSCFRSSWTQGPECKSDPTLLKTINRVLNPPASETSTYTPSKWCTDYLRQTDWSTVSTSTSLTSTYTDWTITHLFVTKTDFDHPTSTRLCPLPSLGAECGYDSNTIAPIEQGEDWSIEHAVGSPTECQQVCLEHSLCKAYRVDGSDASGWNCEIFNVGLGVNASNVVNPTPGGSQWWDRNCGKHVYDACKIAPSLPSSAPFTPTPEVAPQPVITPAPAPPHAALSKRDAPLPPYMPDLSYFWSGVYLTPACSCIITSALPPTLQATTRTITKWIASTTIYSTYEDWFTVTTTPRSTTIYTSVN